MKLSLSGFLFEESRTSQSISFESFCDLAVTCGYEGVELRDSQVGPHSNPGEVAACRTAVKTHGLAVTCLTARHLAPEGKQRDRDFMRYLDFAAEFDCRLFKVNGKPEWLHDMAEIANQRGIALAINTHINSPTETVSGALAFIESVNHPNFGVLYDCMHLAIGGEDYVGAIAKFGALIRNVLVQCMTEAKPQEPETLPHKGRHFKKALLGDNCLQDWPRVVAELRLCGYDGWINVIENGWPAEQREFVARETARRFSDLWRNAKAH